MKFIRHLVPILMVTGLISTQAFAQQNAGQETNFERKRNERDDIIVRDFVQSKENIELKEKTSHLEISGDVRFEYRNLHEEGNAVVIKNDHFREKYRILRGHGAIDTRGLPVSNNDFDVEFNLKFKYNFERAWAAAHVQFDNPAGIRGFNDCINGYTVRVLHNGDSFSNLSSSGSSSDEVLAVLRDSRFAIKGSGEGGFINLKRAYMGYNILADGVHRVDIEIGRRKLDDVFVSEIEFSSRFDGILLKYATSIENFADFYCYGGAFIVDERVNHFGLATELGLLNINDSGLDIRYSLIDWTKRGRNRCFIRNPKGCEFLNSQISFAYNYNTQVFCKEIPTEIYGGFLINHLAKRTAFTHHKKANLGWYIGMYIGEVEKKGDWALDVEYLYVQAQAVNDTDVGGINRGNIQDDHLTDIIFDPSGNIIGKDIFVLDSSDVTSNSSNVTGSSFIEYNGILPRRGNGNYKGARVEFLYAITDNFTVDLDIEVSKEVDRKIGGPHYYAQYEIECIYAF